MKKMIILSLLILSAAILNVAFAKRPVGSVTEDGASPITTLVINASVTVVLVNYDNALLEMAGHGTFTDLVTLSRRGDTLVIGSPKKRDLKEDGTIYVPAGELRDIRINSAASVTSLQALQVPRLNVVVNGACHFSISNIGELNVTGSDTYAVDHDTSVRPVPSGLYGRRTKEKQF
ncbi:MAG: DUF2807 domain-containing protein [Chitinophagaceae bacterium]|nr:DUF2807 domain-containing protein [Chitinophagaceae bacterium]